MLALIPLFPLVGFLVNASLGRRLPKSVSGGLASAAMLASFAVSVMAVMQVAGMAADHRWIEQTLYTWIASGDLSVDVAFRVDPLSSVMILVITGIGSLTCGMMIVPVEMAVDTCASSICWFVVTKR